MKHINILLICKYVFLNKFLICLLAFFLISCSLEDAKFLSEDINDNSITFRRHFTGTIVMYKKGTSLKIKEAQIVNGKFHGYLKIWNEKGLQIINREYQNDELHGTETEWWPNGKIKHEIVYKNNLAKSGKYWSEFGELIKEDEHITSGLYIPSSK